MTLLGSADSTASPLAVLKRPGMYAHPLSCVTVPRPGWFTVTVVRPTFGLPNQASSTGGLPSLGAAPTQLSSSKFGSFARTVDVNVTSSVQQASTYRFMV